MRSKVSLRFDYWVEDVLVDAANAELATVSSDANVTSLTPVFAPRVAHDVVLYAVFFTIANNDYGVVDPCWASVGGGDDTALVVSDNLAACR